jgi:hypothetical protein
MTSLGDHMVESWMVRFDRAREEVLLAANAPRLFTDKWGESSLNDMAEAEPWVNWWFETGRH